MKRLLFYLAMFSLPAMGQWSLQVDVSKDWRAIRGDNPAYAETDFNDSGWAPLDFPRQEEPPEGHIWIRRRITPPPDIKAVPLFLTLGTFAEAYEIWCNGVKIGQTGPFNIGGIFVARPRTWPLPAGLLKPGQAASLALHAWYPTCPAGPRPRQLTVLPDLGPYVLTDRLGIPLDSAFREKLMREKLLAFGFVSSAVRMLLVLLLTGAWLTQRQRKDLLILALLLLADFVTRMGECLLILMDASLEVVKWNVLPTFFSASFLAWFAFTVFKVKWRWPYAAIWLPTVGTFMGWGGLAQGFSAVLVSFSDVAVFVLALWHAQVSLKLIGWRSGRFWMAVAIATVVLLHSQRVGPLTVVGLYLPYGGYLFHLYDIVVILLSAGMTLYLLLSLGADRREKERLASELEAARAVQQLLLPPPVSLTGFATEAVYFPAQQVGGDFYWTRVTSNGELLVLVGDVSGKGLKAAMIVSVAIGVLEREDCTAPGEILTGLNSALVQRMKGGFVTACCVRFSLDGAVTIANAGHPAPYSDDTELAIEAGLPLGVVAGVEYQETIVRGNRFTLVSDGIVEAENAKRELFGFERTREISTKSAKEIAEAAKAWGQTDDITVLTVRKIS